MQGDIIGISVPDKKKKRLICESCDLRDNCNHFLNQSYAFSIPRYMSTHNLPWHSLEETAMYCSKREKIDDRLRILKSVSDSELVTEMKRRKIKCSVS